MKKFRLIVILVLIFVSTANCFAYTYREGLRRELEIEGFVAVYHNVTVTPLVETGSLGRGMPFDITDSEVQYNSLNQNLGRLIASWDFSSTTSKITINIKADPMVYTEDNTITLDYYISFKYKFAQFKADGSYDKDVVGYILTDSTQSGGTSVTFVNAVDQEHFAIIASKDQDIRFMFMNGVHPSLSSYPAGFYTATVNIELIGE